MQIILSFTIQAGLSFLLSGWSILIETRLRVRELFRFFAEESPSRTRARDQAAKLKSLLRLITHLYVNSKIDLIDRVLRLVGNTQLLNGWSYPSFGILCRFPESNFARFRYRTAHRRFSAAPDTKPLPLPYCIRFSKFYRVRQVRLLYTYVGLTPICSVSAAAAAATTSKRPNGLLFSGLLISLYMSLYLAFIILFGLKLRMWDNGVPGRCYYTDRISASRIDHPYDDNIYLGITALWLFGSLTICSWASLPHFRAAMYSLVSSWPMAGKFGISPISWVDTWIRWYWILLGHSSRHSSPNLFQRIWRRLEVIFRLLELFDKCLASAESHLLPYGARTLVLALALIQYPVHGYMVYALRSSNEKHLSGGSEDDWGFGQIVALVLVVSMLLECIKALAGQCEEQHSDVDVSSRKSRVQVVEDLGLLGNREFQDSRVHPIFPGVAPRERQAPGPDVACESVPASDETALTAPRLQVRLKIALLFIL